MTMHNDDYVKSMDLENYKKFTEERLKALANCVNNVAQTNKFILSKMDIKSHETHLQYDQHVQNVRNIEDCLQSWFLGD